MKTITVHFNGEPRSIPEGSTLQQAFALLVDAPEQDGPPVATAVNGQHVARALRSRTPLSAGDQITTFEPITGG